MKKQVCIVLCALVLSQILILPASAFTADSVKITIYDDGDAIIDFHYYVDDWLEKIVWSIAKIKDASLRDESKLIELKFAEWLEKDVEVIKYDASSNRITLMVHDFIEDRKDFKDGYWMSYPRIYTTYTKVFDIPYIGPIIISFRIDDVTIHYPDGYIKTANGEVPYDNHLVSNKLMSYYYRSQYYQTVYEKNYGVYDPNNYPLCKTIDLVGKMIDDIGFNEFVITAGVESIAVSSLPQGLQAISTLKDTIEAITKEDPYTDLERLKEAELMEKVVSESGLIGYMSSGGSKGIHKKIADNMKKMSELKAEETLRMEKLFSGGYISRDNLDSLIANLNAQRNTLNNLNGDANKMVNAVQYTKENKLFESMAVSDDSVLYLESISGLAKQIAENDLNSVNEKLEYLNSYK